MHEGGGSSGIASREEALLREKASMSRLFDGGEGSRSV